MKLKGIIKIITVGRMNDIAGVSRIRNRRIKSAAVDRDTAIAFNQNNGKISAAKRTTIHGKAAGPLYSHTTVNNNCTLYTQYSFTVFKIDTAIGAAVLDRQIRAVNLDKIYAHIRHELQLVTVQVKNISASLEV